MNVLLSYHLDFLSIGLTYVFARYDVPDHLNVGFPGCGQSHLESETKVKHNGWLVASFLKWSVSGTAYLEPDLNSSSPWFAFGILNNPAGT